MANPKDCAEQNPLRELLARKEAGAGPHPLHPLDHLAFSIAVSSGGDVANCLAAIAKLHQDFVDWNEIRVARTQEVARSLAGLPDPEGCALRIKEEYNAFFEKKGALEFEFLAAGKPAEMRRTLGQLLPHLGKGAVSLLLFEFCAGSTLPLSDEGLKQARKDGAGGKSADRGQVARVLAENLQPREIARLLQYWELEATGTPYGEMPKREGGQSGKKAKAGKGKIR